MIINNWIYYSEIHWENIGRMSIGSFVNDQLIPDVIASVVRNRGPQSDAVTEAIRRQYLGDPESGSEKLIGRLSQLLGDSLFTSCVYQTQLLHASAPAPAPVYAYLFNYKGQLTASYSSALGDLLRRSGFNHPLINTGIHFN